MNLDTTRRAVRPGPVPGDRRYRRRAVYLAGAVLLLATQAAVARPQAAPAVALAGHLPERLSDKEFWTLVSDISEPGGYFRIADNFTSNEREVGALFTQLRDRGVKGGVYLGVGPEQNFTYIAAIRPVMAFIVDIRRQAVMQHLMFKAIFEMSPDRADFISMLFGKPRPPKIDPDAPIDQIWQAFWNVPSDSALAEKNFARIVDHLTRDHGFRFTADEAGQLKWVFDAFYEYGPVITTRGAAGGRGFGNGATFADLTGSDFDANGIARSFLSTSENYDYVKTLHEKNLIVPVSGDFGGPKALRAIGAWLHQHGGTVSAFYVSNVEQYLFQDGKEDAFYANVATLPVNDASVFIRPYSMRRFGTATRPLCPIASFLVAAKSARVPGYNEALACAQ